MLKRRPDILLNRFLRIGIEPGGLGFDHQQRSMAIGRHPDSAMLGRCLPSRPRLEDPEKFPSGIGRNIFLHHWSERRAQIVEPLFEGDVQRVDGKGIGTYRTAQEVARAKQDLSLFGRQRLHAIAHEIDLGFLSQPFSQRFAESGQFIRLRTLNSQEHQPPGQARAHLGQQ